MIVAPTLAVAAAVSGRGGLAARPDPPGAREGGGPSPGEGDGMVSALLMLRRLVRTLRYAMRAEDFGAILSAGLALIVIGTVTYSWGRTGA